MLSEAADAASVGHGGDAASVAVQTHDLLLNGCTRDQPRECVVRQPNPKTKKRMARRSLDRLINPPAGPRGPCVLWFQ